MKIGILTLPLHTNYGGILQAYALQTVLERMGHNVKVINYPLYIQRHIFRRFLSFLYRNLRKWILFDKKTNTSWITEYDVICCQRGLTNKFILQKIHNRFTDSLSKIKESEFDIIVVGSDQVWRKNYSSWSNIRDQFLQFAKNWNIKKVSYAASFGKDKIDDYTDNEISDIKGLLRSFQKITVREESGIGICEHFFQTNAIRLVDPTLLLSVDDYNQIIKESGGSKYDGNLLVFVLDDRKEISEFINDTEGCSDFKSFRLNGFDCRMDGSKYKNHALISVGQWLQTFRDADAVVTDSYHACIFSIIYNKPFIVFGNPNRGLSRYETLLNETGLSNRLILSREDAIKKQHLLYQKPNAMGSLKDIKNKSLDFLREI